MSRARLSASSSVCALIPHYGCEAWLGQAIESLLEQSRPPDAIVVIDDASPEPPIEVAAEYPEVTLLASNDNGGPYRLVQAVIDRTRFDAYLFQDADDWSAPDRLEVLLAEAEGTGAELVGSHEVRVMVDQGDAHCVRYPLNVNAALAERSTSFPLLHPTSLVARALVTRLGGFATGMRFSGDAEFLRRAGHAARVVNADQAAYFRRKRSGSLTTDPLTGLGSPERRRVQEVLAQRAVSNAEAVARGDIPDLRPWRTVPAPRLRHLCGPSTDTCSRGPHRPRRGRPQPRSTRPTAPSTRSTPAPVFVMGPPRSCTQLLAWALGQHPELCALPDSGWLTGTALELGRLETDAATLAPSGLLPAVGPALASAACTERGLVAAGPDVAHAAFDLAEMYPRARFLHVVRGADECVSALMASPTEGGVFHSVASAWRTWLTRAQAGLRAEQALGSGSVFRIRHADLVADPERVLRDCLRFLGLTWRTSCVRPLLGLEPVIAAPAPTAAATAAARELSRVLDGPQSSRKPDPPAARRSLAPGPGSRMLDRHRPQSLVERVRALILDAVPEGASVIVVSRGDDRLLDLQDRRGCHFPQVEGGVYAGHHPAGSEEALDQLEELKARGAEYLTVPAPGLWWLGFYEGLRRHLEEHAELVAFHEETGAVWRLAPPASNPGSGPTARFAAVPDLVPTTGGSR